MRKPIKTETIKSLGHKKGPKAVSDGKGGYLAKGTYSVQTFPGYKVTSGPIENTAC